MSVTIGGDKPVTIGGGGIKIDSRILEIPKYASGVTKKKLPSIATDDFISVNSIDLGNNYKYMELKNTGENQTTYNINFPESTVCDILVVGGGGGGGQFGGGGGAGGLLFKSGIALNGNYTIKVGKGGIGVNVDSINGENGKDSSIIINNVEYIAVGGGGGGTRMSAGLSYSGRGGNTGGSGGGGSHSDNGGTANAGGTSIKNTYSGWESYGFGGGEGKDNTSGTPGWAAGGGGGAGSAGEAVKSTGGGNGGTGRDYSSYFGTNVGHNGWFAGGGGGQTYGGGGNPGYANGGINLFGGGGNGGHQSVSSAGEAIPNTGGGGGGSAAFAQTEAEDGGDGGSGVVLIRFLSTEVIDDEPTVDTKISTYIHSGRAENQTSYSLNFPLPTLCDILVVGGGGGASAGGGGAGGYLYYTNITLQGAFTINVGNGGAGVTGSTAGNQGFNSSLIGSSFNIIAYGGGGGGGNGAAAPTHTAGQVGSYGGGGMDYTIAQTAQTYTSRQGFMGGVASYLGYGSGGGGGGAGGIGKNPTSLTTSTTLQYRELGGYGGVGLSNNITGSTVFYAGGGAGGTNTNTTSTPTTFGIPLGGNGGGGNGNLQHIQTGFNAVNGTGGGGGGGDWERTAVSGSGGSGIVIIRYKLLSYIVKNAYSKFLAFTYQPIDKVEAVTGVSGWRLVRFLHPTANAWHPTNDNLAGTTTYGTAYNYTNAWSIPFGTYDEFCFGTFNLQYWLYTTRVQAIGANYDNAARTILKSSVSATRYNANWYNRTGSPEDPWIGLRSHLTQPVNNPAGGGDMIMYGENSFSSGHWTLPAISMDGGMCVWVRDSTLGVNTTYNVNFPQDAVCDVLIVAGGGGGGMDMGGGGGGGGVIMLESQLITAGNYTVTVGKGGNGAPAAGTDGQNTQHHFGISATNGHNSSFNGNIAIGGGYGGSSYWESSPLFGQGNSGGSGGGSSGYNAANNINKAGTGVAGQGFRGGYGLVAHHSGGGGGAGEIGGGAPLSGNGVAKGGDGKPSYITGTKYFWGGGGGGAGYSSTGGNGGKGGGGGGAVGVTLGGSGITNGANGGGGVINAWTNTPGGNGGAHTGGGGGGGSHYTANNKGGDGGSGIVIISFKADNHYYPYNIGEWVYNDYNTDTYYLGRVGINNFNPTSELHVNGNTFSTSYLGGSKTFKIEHPLNIKDKYLYHGCVEGPRFDNIYRGKKIIKNGRGEVIIDKECNTTGGMSLGTFLELNTNYHLYLQNNETFDSVKGYIENGKIIIYSKNIIDEIEIDWMVFGERKDAEIRKSLITDSEGRLICEHNI